MKQLLNKKIKEEIVNKVTENDEVNENFLLTIHKKPGVYKQRSIHVC